MSIYIDYLFNSDIKFEQLVKEINKILGSNLTQNETVEENSSGTLFGMPLSFYAHRLENDGEINFQDYKYEIGVTTYSGGADLRNIQVLIVSLIANVLYRRMKVSEGILVFDAQLLLARYTEKFNSEIDGNDLFDIVSNKFVEFPQHLIDLDKLAWQ